MKYSLVTWLGNIEELRTTNTNVYVRKDKARYGMHTLLNLLRTGSLRSLKIITSTKNETEFLSANIRLLILFLPHCYTLLLGRHLAVLFRDLS